MRLDPPLLFRRCSSALKSPTAHRSTSEREESLRRHPGLLCLCFGGQSLDDASFPIAISRTFQAIIHARQRNVSLGELRRLLDDGFELLPCLIGFSFSKRDRRYLIARSEISWPYSESAIQIVSRLCVVLVFP